MDDDLIRRLEELAGLTCDPAERAALSRDLRDMVAYVDRLEAFVDGCAPAAATPGGNGGRLREDRPRPSLARRDALSGAAASDGTYVLVPPLRRGGGR
ncbi:aspartyl/glutamyl-tRNA amidotransferase subunit C [bacterium]|nr:aspartyl/glutamyl-tRNA amidotransferase subunit C [bacterium]